jgi:hypothetical protein
MGMMKKVFYQTAEKSPLQRQVYSVGLDGKNKKEITPVGGTNEAQFSSTFDYYVNTHSAANEPASYTVYDRKGKLLRVIEDNQGIKDLQVEYGTTPVEFFDFTTSEKVKLNGYMILILDKRILSLCMSMAGRGVKRSLTPLVVSIIGGFKCWLKMALSL